MSHKIELKNDAATGQNVLTINEKPMFCAYKSPVAVSNSMGMPSILQIPCTDACPLFRQDAGIIALNCGSEKVIYKLDIATKMSKM